MQLLLSKRIIKMSHSFKPGKNKPNQSQPVVSLPALPALSAVEGSVVDWVESIAEAKKYSYSRNFLFDIYT
jgi:hypothetical protein